MSEGKPVKLHIKSTQTDNNGIIDSMEFYTEGRYFEKQGGRYVSYKESEISGLEGTTTVLKFGTGEVSLVRTGAISSKMVFRIGSETRNSYRTQYGTFDLVIQTQKLDIDICNNLISSVYLRYKLSMNSGEAFINEMAIRLSYTA